MTKNNPTLEIINKDAKRGDFTAALLDFDGTISLIREGWQEIMKPYFVQELLKTPEAESKEEIETIVDDFVDFLTGKQTIYQCIRLAEEIEARGGQPLDPQAYKDEYHSRLLDRIEERLAGLESGEIQPRDMVVPGSFELLDSLKEAGLKIYIASGTDEDYVLNEAKLLGVTEYCDGIFGAQTDYKLFSKKMIVNQIIKNYKLQGHQLLGLGDGYVEIENVKEAGGFAVGVASNESERQGIDAWKRERLIQAGADIIIPDYSDMDELKNYLFEEEDKNAIYNF